MNQQKIIIELKTPLNKEDFLQMRILYMPLIGAISASLYSLLYDFNALNKSNGFFSKWKDFKNILNVSFEELEKAKNKLEAVGLLTTYEKADNETFICSINKPSTVETFKKNIILYKETIKKIGESLFEKVQLSVQRKMSSKDEYKDITMKYQDVFTINNFKVENTMEIPVFKYNSIEEATIKLNSLQFINYISEKKPSPAQISLINRIQMQNMPSSSINLIINYSFEKNGQIVNNHIEAIANDFLDKSLIAFETIKSELANARGKFWNKKPKHSEKIEEYVLEDNNTDWKTLFKELGSNI